MNEPRTSGEERSRASAPPWSGARWWREWEVAALGVLVFAIFFTRLEAVPICGEESRWAGVAREMIASGDWIVPRQQGALFAERPPLGSWAIGLVGLARGEVDLLAVRLPSAIATLLTVWLVYAYARTWSSRRCGLAAAAIYATFGQVMILGRFGESEALFTLLTAGALLVWHAGYVRGHSIALVWSLGYSLAALGALAKGLQAPVYFVAASVVFLLVRRDWRWLFARGHAVGLACFAAIVGAWLVPFARGRWHALDDIWMGLASDRFTLDRLPAHVVTYPAETLACLVPWSALLVALLFPRVRRAIWAARPQIQFIVVALAVTYPTVWLAAGARGRYFMPLYPCVAVLMGVVVEHCTARGVSRADFALWRQFLRGTALVTVAGGAALVVIGVLPAGALSDAQQRGPFLACWIAGAAISAALMLWSARSTAWPRPQIAVLTVAAFAGLAYAGAMVNHRVRGGNDLAPAVAAVKRRIPAADELVSLGRVYHRFAYSYEVPIRQVPWPTSTDQLPDDITFFCFDRRPQDTAQERAGNDDRLGAHTPGMLPFAWEKVAEVPCDPVRRAGAHRWVVIGRVQRLPVAEQSAATRLGRR